MSHFIKFAEDQGLLVEISAGEYADALHPGDNDGLVQTGYAERIGERVVAVAGGLQGSLARTITASGQAVIDASKAIEPAPEEIEVSFGVNATGEVGNVAIGKGSGQANFTVRLKWRSTSPG